MKFMAGIAVIIIGVIFIIVGIFILSNKTYIQAENLAETLPVKQESKILISGVINKTGEVTSKNLIKGSSEDSSKYQNYKVGVNQEKIPAKELAINSKTEAERKGIEFEKFVVQKFDHKYFTLKEWTSDKFVAGVYAENTLGPDLVYQFSLREISEGLAIECKWRSKLSDKFNFVTAQQIKNYKKFESEKNIPVFLVLGVGGNPSSPEQLYIIPLNRIDSPVMNNAFLKEFQQDTHRNVYYDYKAKSLIAKDFNKVKEQV